MALIDNHYVLFYGDEQINAFDPDNDGLTSLQEYTLDGATVHHGMRLDP